MANLCESFHCATVELVRSTPIKQRLVRAYTDHLASLREDQLPADVREPFKQVMRFLRGVKPLRGEDAVAASVRKMSNQDANDCAALIVEIFGLMSRAYFNAGRTNAGVVQLHSVDCTPGEFEVPALIANN
jgi:hypothetical protein